MTERGEDIRQTSAGLQADLMEDCNEGLERALEQRHCTSVPPQPESAMPWVAAFC